MFTVYAISSLSRNYIYVGQSSELEARLKRHNKGQNKTTKAYAPFKRIHTGEFESRREARKYEVYLKSGVGIILILDLSKGKMLKIYFKPFPVHSPIQILRT